MILSKLIHRQQFQGNDVATATSAIPATVTNGNRQSVAKIATIAVAVPAGGQPYELSYSAFAQVGLELLPEDLLHLKKLLPFERSWRDNLIKGYISAWLDGADNETDDHKKQNRGRYAANSWLMNAARRD